MHGLKRVKFRSNKPVCSRCLESRTDFLSSHFSFHTLIDFDSVWKWFPAEYQRDWKNENEEKTEALTTNSIPKQRKSSQINIRFRLWIENICSAVYRLSWAEQKGEQGRAQGDEEDEARREKNTKIVSVSEAANERKRRFCCRWAEVSAQPGIHKDTTKHFESPSGLSLVSIFACVPWTLIKPLRLSCELSPAFECARMCFTSFPFTFIPVSTISYTTLRIRRRKRNIKHVGTALVAQSKQNKKREKREKERDSENEFHLIARFLSAHISFHY